GTTTLTSEDVTIPGPCANTFSIVRTWTVTDNCGATNTTAQTIQVVDNTAPVAPPAPADLTLTCAAELPPPTSLTAVDNCSGNISVAPLDQVMVSGCDNQQTIVRTWTFVDDCGNVSTISQTIVINDNIAPILNNIPASTTVQCFEDVNLIGTPNATDNCGSVTITMDDVAVGDACSGSITRTWTAIDACGNTATASQIINYGDSQAPVADNVPADRNIACGENLVFGPAPTWTDNCNGPVSVSEQDITAPGACPNDQVVTRFWSALDQCGNLAVVSQTITVSDTEAPVFTFVPDGGVMECGTTPNFGNPTAEDNCGSVDITFVDQDNGSGPCNNEVVRTWTETDACGNATTVSRTIMIVDNEAPIFTFVPDGGVMECGTTPSFGNPMATDNCGAVDITFVDQDNGNGPCNNEVIRTWTATDACGNATTVSRTIMIVDNEAPVFTFVPDTPDVDCDEIPDFETPVATDNCGMVTLTFVEYQSPGTLCDNGFALKRDWTAMDACGNVAEVTTAIWVYPDVTAPVFTSVPATPDVDCDQIPEFETPTVEDDCSNVTLTFVEYQSPGTLCDNGYALKRDWTAVDDCGNVAEVTTSIWVYPDIAAPVFTFIPANESIDCNAFPPTFGDPEVEDDCGTVTLTFETEFVSGGPNSCAIGEAFIYRRVWTATDDCGNQSTAAQIFAVSGNQNTTAIISWHLYNEESEPIEAASLEVEGPMAGGGTSMMTGVDGYYNFSLPQGGNYMLAPYKNDDPLNGVSTYDLVLMSKHILGIELLDSPYKIIAADVNRSGELTAFDLVELRKMILFINTEFPDNTSWRFVESDFVFPNQWNPFATTFPEAHSINGLDAAQTVDFVAIKTGDVNNNAVPNQLSAGETRNTPATLTFHLLNQQLTAGKEHVIYFTATQFRQLLGYQMTLQLDRAHLDLIDLQPGALSGLTAANFGMTRWEEGIITTSWHETVPQNLGAEEIVFSLLIRAKSTITLSEVLRLGEKWTAPEAYDDQANRLDVALDFVDLPSTTLESTFRLEQNQPNPFQESTVIRFYLPKATQATLTLYDLSGRVVKNRVQTYAAGQHEVLIDRNDLPNNGVLYYQLKTESHSATRKMLLLQP
ncbi:MAG: T9SS type A sorting domain-containing protein, partial [Bacteroidota bacterium]